ncbi:MAG: AbrB/MazE/SpoVT family DNA-binding domain-containing protein [Clostridiales bacterium]|nr:AbrB/MazE/SpoVT family DNA-binding domain-containing protein [Clostridiales bacterium]MCD7827760.1 AbrB/MazE/SpoVT family DNA-binding domain-containing protein [Clostridiales bacterium]
MTTTIQKWGNSQGIRIPKFMLDEVHWCEGEPLMLRIDKDKIIVEKAEPRKNIIELFADFEGEYVSPEIDWGEPAGKEIW